MEFWGVEVKAGEPLMVKPEEDQLIHISQASLGEGKKGKGNDFVPLRLKIDDKKFVLGTLSADKSPQLTFDLVIHKEFELSHDWKNGSVYFLGYKADNDDDSTEDEDGFGFSEDEDEDEDLPLLNTENGKFVEPKVEKVKPTTNKGNTAKPESSAKPKVVLMEPKKDNESDEDDEEDDSDDDEEDSDDAEGDEDMLDATDDSSDDEESDDEDEETPKKLDQGKKRPTESAIKTPVPAKKAKLSTPQKTDGKKGGSHTATPHPSKQAGKTPASGGKLKGQSPKSGSQVSCNSCSKTFNSESALQSHSKAKHGDK